MEIGEDEELENYYCSVFLVLVTERMTAENKQASADFHKAVPQDEVDTSLKERKSAENSPWKRQAVFMEEEEDESTLVYRLKEKSMTGLMYEVDHEGEEPLVKEAYSVHNTEQPSHESCLKSSPKNGLPSHEDTTLPPPRPKEIKDPPKEIEEPTITAAQHAPPPTKEKLFRIPKARSRPEGMSAIGVSVLSTRGFVGGLNNIEMDLQLDSCADITLISHKFYESLTSKPSIKQGMRMCLWQLMDKDSQLKGFVHIPIYMTTVDGDILETEAEAYVVPNMTVPILLGEDYQQSYELGVTRNIEEGTHVSFGRLEHKI